MPMYVILGNLTDQGARSIKESPARMRQSLARAQEAGGKIHGVYYTMGPYDYVIIAEAPSDEALMRQLMSVAGRGTARTMTMKAFPLDEYEKIVGSLD